MNSLNEISAINMVVRTRLKIKKNKINKIENFGLPFNYLSPFQFLIIFTYLFLILLSYYSIKKFCYLHPDQAKANLRFYGFYNYL